MNVHGVNEVTQTKLHIAEQLVPEPSAFEVELAIEKLKSHKSPDIDQIPAEMFKAGGKKIRSEIHTFFYIWNKAELPEEGKELIIAPIHQKGDKINCTNYRDISLLPAT